jgi:Protein of unknown function (DUF707)
MTFSSPQTETVRSFAHEPLNTYELLCLRSFAARGYHLELYSYDPSLALPDWIELKNAAEILPSDRVLRYRSGTGPGSFSVHVNLFRYALLHRLGGWWTDTDIFLLRPDLPAVDSFFAAAGQLNLASTNLLKFPSDHPLLAEAIERAAVLDPPAWAQAGEPLLTGLLQQHDLTRLCRPRTETSPIPWFELTLLFDPAREGEARQRCSNSIAVDLHNELWRGAGIPRHLAPPEGSFIDACLRLHDLGTNFLARMNYADVALWIEHLSSSIGLDAQLRALQSSYRALEAKYRTLEAEHSALVCAGHPAIGERKVRRLPESETVGERRRTLVVLRAGDHSLHPAWLAGGVSESRTWDLHLSYFGDGSTPFPNRPDDVTLSFEKGTKGAGTASCLKKIGDRLEQYDWVCLPDDDLAADLLTLNRFFAIVEEYQLDLAQPALGAGSYAAHDISLQRPHMTLRFTSFVESMAICFSRRALTLALPFYDATASSWGVDFLFPKLLGYPRDKIAIVDETPVIHTRPVGRGPNIALTRQLGSEPNEELERFLRQHGLTVRFDTWGGITRDGRYTSNLAEIERFKVSPAV